jgi:hypothetical protein
MSSAANASVVQKVAMNADKMMLREKNSRIRDVQTNFILSCKRTMQQTND